MTHPTWDVREPALVIVHPYVASGGLPDELARQQELLRDWEGPLVVLLDRGGRAPATPHATEYLDHVFEATSSREERGWECRIDGDEDAGLLEDAIERLLDVAPDTAEFVVTGACRERSCRVVATLISEGGRSAAIDESAVSLIDGERLIGDYDEDFETQVLAALEE